VSDKDDDPQDSFNQVQNELRKAGFPIPVTEQTVARKNEYPEIVVLMLPIRGKGNLETLCVEAMLHKWPLKDALNAFVTATPATEWGISKQSKMRMQSILASTCKDQPDVSFARHWELKPEYRLPLDHHCFEELVRFLRNFPNLLTAMP